MLENYSKYVPLLTLITLAIISAFNIGYFWKVGVHFIGVMDLTNVIYSFALLFPFVIVLAFLFTSDLVTNALIFVYLKSETATRSEILRGIGLPVLLSFVLIGAMGMIFWGWRLFYEVWTLFYVHLAALTVLYTAVIYFKHKAVPWPLVLTSTGIVLYAAANLGGTVVTNELNRKDDT
jgi:hypothetical protein